MRLKYIFLFLVIYGCIYFSNISNKYIDMRIIAIIESKGNFLAYNQKSGAVGLYQITPICFADYNKYHTKKITRNDLYNPILNYKVANWYIKVRIPQMLRHYNQSITTRNILICYNAGIKYIVEKKELKKETKNYIIKYYNLLKDKDL